MPAMKHARLTAVPDPLPAYDREPFFEYRGIRLFVNPQHSTVDYVSGDTLIERRLGFEEAEARRRIDDILAGKVWFPGYDFGAVKDHGTPFNRPLSKATNP